jgi:hypothetical protein
MPRWKGGGGGGADTRIVLVVSMGVTAASGVITDSLGPLDPGELLIA